MLHERKSLRDSGGNAQQKAEILMKSTTMCIFYVFFFFLLNCGFCETLECNAEAFQELWHSEKGKDWSGGRWGLRIWPLILNRERKKEPA